MNVIDRARERIERDGWWKKGQRVSGPQTCLMLALHCNGEAEWYDATAALCAEAGIEVSGSASVYEALAAFNNDPSTSLEDLLLLMKRASARLDEETR